MTFSTGKRFFALLTAVFFVFSCGGNAEGDKPGGDNGGENNQPPAPVFQEEADDPAADPSGLFDFSKLKAQGHPRLVMDAADFEAIKAALPSNDVVRRFHELLIWHADQVVGSNPARLKYQIVDNYLIYVSWVAVDRILACAYAYRMTGDKKYSAQVEKDLTDISLFQDWYPDHYLGTAELSLAAAIGYDWCYDALPLNVRKMTRSALNLFAFQSVTQNIYKRTNNWNPVCLCGLTLAAMATYEKNKAASAAILNAAIPSNTPALDASYSPGGVYPEGYNYWGYGTMTEAIMLSAFKKSFGEDYNLSKHSGWTKTPDYILYMVGPSMQSFNYSDCGPGCSPKAPMWYFASELGRPDIVSTERRMLEGGIYQTSAEWRFLPLGMRWVLDTDTSHAANPPQKRLWASLEGEVPIALIRDGWTWTETDKYLGLKGGMADAPHGHMDAGSFVYEAFGQRWAEDIGPEEYAPLEALFAQTGHKLFAYDRNSMRWTCFRFNALSHNTISVNNGIHNPQGMATITAVYDDETALGADLNMSAPLGDFLSSASRKFRLDGDALNITDAFSVRGSGAATVSWHIATTATATLEEGRIRLEKGGKTVYLTVSGTGGTPTLKVYPAAGDKSYDTPNPGYTMVGWEIAMNAGASGSFTTTLKP